MAVVGAAVFFSSFQNPHITCQPAQRVCTTVEVGCRDAEHPAIAPQPHRLMKINRRATHSSSLLFIGNSICFFSQVRARRQEKWAERH